MIVALTDRLIINSCEILYAYKQNGLYYLVFKNGVKIDICKEDFNKLALQNGETK